MIKVRTKGTKNEGVFVGADKAHHQLILDSNGNLQFFNIQCCAGTGKIGDYEFVTKKSDWGNEVEFGTIWDVLNIYSEFLGIQNSKEFDNVLQQLKVVFDKAIAVKNKKLNEFIQKILADTFEEKDAKN